MLPLRAIVLTGLLAVLTAGCASFTGFPAPPTDPDADVKNLAAYFDKDVIEKYLLLRGDARKRRRDEVVYGRMRAYDIQFREFEKALAYQTGASYLSTDLLAVALTGLSATVGDKGTKTALAVASGGVMTAKGAIDKDLFYEKTMPALFAQMEAERLKVRAAIMAGLATDDDHYSLPNALADLERYVSAGSLPGAIAGIVQDAGSKSQEAEKAIVGVTRDGVFLQFRELFRAQEKRLAGLAPDKALAVAKAMEPFLASRSTDLIHDLKTIDPDNKHQADGESARKFLKFWVANDERSAITLQQWSDAIDKAQP